MYVCLCYGITESQIRAAAEQGCSDIESLAAQTGCGTGCGCCKAMAAELVSNLQTPVALPVFSYAA